LFYILLILFTGRSPSTLSVSVIFPTHENDDIVGCAKGG